MLVNAWEAIISEKKVLVVGSIPSTVSACCEFLRRISLPLVTINTFVPLLPTPLINAIEAPFPYLLGVETSVISDSGMDLTGTVVIDLDNRIIIPQSDKVTYPDVHPPDSLIVSILRDVNKILLSDIGEWSSRSTTSGLSSNPHAASLISPTSDHSINFRANSILQVFIRVNLQLLSSRYCSVKAFYRRPKSNLIRMDEIPKRDPSSITGGTMGFDRKFKSAYGFMQLMIVKTLNHSVSQSYLTSCWVEVNDIVFVVYEFADNLPLLYIPIKDIVTVSPTSTEPEGHVFEITYINRITANLRIEDEVKNDDR